MEAKLNQTMKISIDAYEFKGASSESSIQLQSPSAGEMTPSLSPRETTPSPREMSPSPSPCPNPNYGLSFDISSPEKK